MFVLFPTAAFWTPIARASVTTAAFPHCVQPLLPPPSFGNAGGVVVWWWCGCLMVVWLFDGGVVVWWWCGCLVVVWLFNGGVVV